MKLLVVCCGETAQESASPIPPPLLADAVNTCTDALSDTSSIETLLGTLSRVVIGPSKPHNANVCIASPPITRLLLAAMNTHWMVPKIASGGCNVIAHLFFATTKAKTRLLQSEPEIIRTVLRVMAAHLADFGVQRNALAALVNISAADNAWVEHAVVKGGGLELILAALRQHGAASDLLADHACLALEKLSYENSTVRRLRHTDCVEVVKHVMELYPNDKNLQTSAKWFLRHLLWPFA